MAGRSGAAAIEVELRDAAQRFDAKQLAERVRKSGGDETLAAALDAVVSETPQFERREGEVFLAFRAGSEQAARRMDCTAASGLRGCGLEVLLLDGSVLGVSFYLE